MYKVIIVDDEKQILDGLTKMIKWEELGFEVCAVARNGVEAIPFIRDQNIDLVLTDIRMPKMDGLMLLEYVRKYLSRDIEFIILSGYSEFHYAQKAMRFNVKNYILKPIDEGLLYGTLIDIKQILNEKEIRKSQRINHYIQSIIKGDSSDNHEHHLDHEAVYGLRHITIERHRSFLKPKAGRKKETPDLYTVISEKIDAANMRFVLGHDHDACHMVVGQSLLRCYQYDVFYMVECLKRYLKNAHGISVDVYIGKKVKKFRDLHDSIQTISKCKNVRFYKTKPSVILYDDIEEQSFCKIYEDNGAVIRVITAFRRNEIQKMLAALEELIKQFKQFMVVPEIVLVHMDSIMASMIQILSERTENISSVVEKYAEYKKIQSQLSLSELGRIVSDFCVFCNEFTLNCLAKENMDIVDKVMQYVKENYMKPLKIIDIAEIFFVNPAYLGQQFIKRENMSLNHFMNTIRIEKSKELLLNTNLKIYEIAVKVGFDDPNYFSAKFFEYAQKTPSEFRNDGMQ